MNTIPKYAVIPTHDRPYELQRLLQSLLLNVEHIFVIDNASNPAMTTIADISKINNVHILYDSEQPPNLSRLWNVGFDAVECHAKAYEYTAWDVIVLNDDAIIPNDWCRIVCMAVRAHDVIVASTGAASPSHNVWISRTPNEGGLTRRLCPWAFVMRGEAGLRADERMKWWYGDNDFDWTARAQGGIALVPGPVVINEHANATTAGALLTQTGYDREAFVAKWGYAPW